MSKKDLNSLSFEELGELFPVRLADFSSGWKNLYSSEKEKILNLFEHGEITRIEHIGSTAIPEIKAKPTIDILLEVKESSDSSLIISKLESIDYEYIPKPENPPPHMMLAKGYSSDGSSGQAFHIHVRYPGKQDEILFRDYLVSNPEARDEYEKLKLTLAAQSPNNRELYTIGKTRFVKRIIRLARENH
jgi:GrpB-like predicted nucleotidyltransferase (UPF0157 family)